MSLFASLLSAFLLLGSCCHRALTLTEQGTRAVGSSYELEADGDTISVFGMSGVDIEDDAGEDDEASESVSSTSLRNSLRQLHAKTTEKDCRKPNPKKQTCRKPGKKKSPPPPPKRPPPPPPFLDEYVYEAPPIPASPPPFLDEYVYEAPGNIPSPSPPPPITIPSPPPPVPIPYRQVECSYTPRRRILSGSRLSPNGGIRPCTGLHVADPGACCEVCRGTVGCNGWMYSKPLDCRVFGQTAPENVCYMISDVTGSYDPVMPELTYFSGTADY
jgi:hypothetical protein